MSQNAIISSKRNTQARDILHRMIIVALLFGGCDSASTSEDSSDMMSPDMMSPDMMSPHMMSPDMMSPDMMVGSCEGLYTSAECLALSGAVREAEGAWRAISDEQFNWGESRALSVSVSFDDSNERDSLIEDYSPSALPSGETTIKVRPLYVSAPQGASSIEVNFEGLSADRIFQAGYQSWSFSGVIELPLELSLNEEGHVFTREALTGDPMHGAQGVSFGLIGGQVGAQAESGVWLLGHLDPSYTLTAFSAAQEEGDSEIRLKARIGFEELPLSDQSEEGLSASPSAEGMITQELGLITAPTMWLALRAYQELLSERLDLLRDRGLRSEQSVANAKRPPKGWYSWNERFEEIDSAYIMTHLNLVSERLAPSGFPLVEIDDGWQMGWGDWRSNEHFPNDFEPIVESANQLNLTLGLWFAPFLVDVDVAQQLDYPHEWFVFPLEESQSPLEHRIIGNPRTYYILDTSHPDAMTHVLTELAARAAQGFRYFKLDFLYAAAIPGRRAQAISGLESLRRGLAAIREAIGQESFINACGAPVHAVLGYADSLRIGADTTFGELYPAFIASAARSAAARAYLYPLIWPDADQVQLRAPYTVDEAEVGAYVAALSGPAYSIGDDLSLLPEERLAIFLDQEKLWWSALPTPSIPLDLMSQPSPEWFGNPLPDHLRAPGGTSAPPPSQYLGLATDGELRLLEIDWSAPFSARVESLIPSSGAQEDTP